MESVGGGVARPKGSEVTKKGLKSWDPGFKFPDPIHGAFPQEVYRDLKLASVERPGIQEPWYFQI